jgi:hypothetical protein
MKFKNRLWIRHLYSILPFCCMVLLIAVACTSSAGELPDPTTEPTPRPLTPTSQPTNSPTPTNTAVPTNTIAPTKTIVSDPYRTDFLTRFPVFNDALGDYADLIIEFELLPERTRSDEWKLKAIKILEALDQAANQIESIPEVPDKYVKLDNYLDELAAETHILVENFSSFVERRDKNTYDRATKNLLNINAIMEDTINEMKQVILP